MAYALAPIIIQAIIFAIDEFFFHRKRSLKAWEVLGHPVDTVAFLIPLSLCFLSISISHKEILFLIASVFSCLVITKDEWIHKKESCGTENWLHSLLFILHPVVLFSIWELQKNNNFITLKIIFCFVFFVFFLQIVNAVKYFFHKKDIDKSHYSSLNDGWYDFDDHPVAFLRAQSRLFSEWIVSSFDLKDSSVLDVACGGGFLSNALSPHARQVTGIDLDNNSLNIAKKHDRTRKVIYIKSSAESLSFEDEAFDLVCIMDFLEHVADPLPVLKEAARVLKPKGVLVIHTFNRSFLSWLFAIQAITLLFPKAPSNIHVLELFRKPSQTESIAISAGLKRVAPWRGVRPVLSIISLLQIVFFSKVRKNFKFKWTRSTAISYVGVFSKV